MTPADLDALVARINALADCSYWANVGWDIPGDATQVIGRLAVKAAAALVQLRDSEALARGKLAEQMIEIARLQDDTAEIDRLRGENARLRHPTAADEAIAAGDGTLHGAIDHWQQRADRAEAEVARLKDALRQANGVRDVFASAVVAQAMQDPAEPKCDTCPRGVSNAIRNLKERRG